MCGVLAVKDGWTVAPQKSIYQNVKMQVWRILAELKTHTGSGGGQLFTDIIGIPILCGRGKAEFLLCGHWQSGRPNYIRLLWIWNGRGGALWIPVLRRKSGGQ